MKLLCGAALVVLVSLNGGASFFSLLSAVGNQIMGVLEL